MSSTSVKTSKTALTYRPRTTEPTKGVTGWEYYTSKLNGGYFPAIQAATHKPASSKGCTALHNCVNYALGRANEIHGSWKWNYPGPGNAWVWWDNVPAKWGWKRGDTPQVGSILCFWKNNTDPDDHGPGHVAVVEKIESNGSIWISESQYSSSSEPWCWRYRKVTPPYYGYGTYYTVKGFLYHPDVTFTLNTNSTNPDTTEVDAISSADPGLKEYNEKVIQQHKTVVASNYNTSSGLDLLSSNVMVESPFIIAKIGDYTFGSYTKYGSIERSNSTASVTYPNYMKSITINKTNGVLNVYTLEMIYQIIPGKDPNLLDRVFSTVSGSREITLTYGDWNAPSFIYKEEQAIITNITSKVDFANQCITYTLSCTSKALQAAAQSFTFEGSSDKTGSEILYNIINTEKYGLKKVFTAMTDDALVKSVLPWDDKVIKVEAKQMDPLKYINYIIGSMSSKTNSDDAIIKDSTYHMIIVDDVDGLYFKVVKVGTSTRNVTSADIYEVDIGFPTSTLVTGFDVNTDNSWSILYNYSDSIDMNKYVYSIDDNGIVKSDYVDAKSALSAYNKRVTEINKTWWTKMTQFPITATLTIKGLLRPAVLMNYVRVNTYFYGQKHVSSGLYAITKQEDTIDMNGYRTVLSLTRISGDVDETLSYVQSAVKTTE